MPFMPCLIFNSNISRLIQVDHIELTKQLIFYPIDSLGVLMLINRMSM
jgi:hypothetical protein